MIQKMAYSMIAHELHIASSNGMLGRAVKMLSEKYPECESLIRSMSTKGILSAFGFEHSFSTINEVALAFKANRAAMGIKEPYKFLA